MRDQMSVAAAASAPELLRRRCPPAGSGLSLLGYREAQPSIIGIMVLIVAAIGMPRAGKSEKGKWQLRPSSRSVCSTSTPLT
jgi:hypothetical protein